MPDPFPWPSADHDGRDVRARTSDAHVSASADACGLIGHRILSGTGEDIGVVVGVEPDRFGRPKKLAFLEEGAAAPRFVPLRFVRDIRDGVVKLAGPREGYHITKVGTSAEDRFGRA